MFYGLLNLSLVGYIVAILVLTHITVVSITLFLHRAQAHRALDLHPILSHFFRFWLWMTTGMVTREWVAIHRKHHARSDVEGDPHSPQVFGIKKVFFEGAELYREEATNQDTLLRFSHGTPNDWIERKLYSRYNYLGITILFFIDIFLFGVPGLTVWALQMLWTPLFAAGVINGIGHYWGYRNFECDDAARNILPIGIFVGGEELHNNHHTFGTSAKFSAKWWEFDIGWFYIKLFSLFGLAKARRTIPTLYLKSEKTSLDLESLKAIVNNRFQVMTRYSKEVIIPVLKEEKEKASEAGKNIFKHAKKLLIRETSLINNTQKDHLNHILNQRENLNLVYQYRLKLQAIWTQTTASHRELMEAIQEWCKQAEATGIEALAQFSNHLKSIAVKPESTAV